MLSLCFSNQFKKDTISFSKNTLFDEIPEKDSKIFIILAVSKLSSLLQFVREILFCNGKAVVMSEMFIYFSHVWGKGIPQNQDPAKYNDR